MNSPTKILPTELSWDTHKRKNMPNPSQELKGNRERNLPSQLSIPSTCFDKLASSEKLQIASF